MSSTPETRAPILREARYDLGTRAGLDLVLRHHDGEQARFFSLRLERCRRPWGSAIYLRPASMRWLAAQLTTFLEQDPHARELDG